MQGNRNTRPRRSQHYINKKQPHFEVTKYLDNPHMIENLHQHHVDAIEWAKHLEEQLDSAEDQIESLKERTHELELAKQKLEIEVTQTTSISALLDSEKKEAQAEAKALITQLAEVNAANHRMEVENTTLEHKLEDTQNKLEVQNLRINDMLNRCHTLEERGENLQLANHRMKLRYQRLGIALNTAHQMLDQASGKWRTFPQYIVTIVATAILSYGTSVVASSPSSVLGWGFVIAGGILEIIAFIITLTSRLKKIADPETEAELERVAQLERIEEIETEAELKRVAQLETVTDPERTVEHG